MNLFKKIVTFFKKQNEEIYVFRNENIEKMEDHQIFTALEEGVQILCVECHAIEHPRYKRFIKDKYVRKKTMDK